MSETAAAPAPVEEVKPTETPAAEAPAAEPAVEAAPAAVRVFLAARSGCPADST